MSFALSHTAYLVAFITPHGDDNAPARCHVRFAVCSDRNPTTMGGGTMTYVVDQEQRSTFGEAYRALKNRLDKDPRYVNIGARSSGDYRLATSEELRAFYLRACKESV